MKCCSPRPLIKTEVGGKAGSQNRNTTMEQPQVRRDGGYGIVVTVD